MRFYLDTEFNGHGGELISLALVPLNGQHFYAAKEFSGALSEWVADNVMPVLNTRLLRKEMFKAVFHAWITQFKDPEIICDWHADAVHFCSMLEGSTFDSSLDFACTIKILKTPPGEPVSEIPHNALADARALMKWYEAQPTERKSHV